MSRIVYLLGAGASHGKRNDDVTKNSLNHIKEGLPIVSEIIDEIDVVTNWLRNVEITENKIYSFKGYDSEQMRKELIDGLLWMKEKSAQHATIDTFAKKIFLNVNMNNDYGRLKLLLTSFFLIEQYIHEYDKRYDTFFANILNDDTTMPDDIYILTWNYDLQLDIAYREYNRFGIEMCVPSEPNCETTNSEVFKINGTANFYNTNQIDTERLLTGSPEHLLDAIFYQFCVTCEHGSYSSGTTDLFFAWEKETFNQKSQYLYEKLSDAEVLIVIGYTFPFFNRTIDREIFSNMPKLKSIYIQDPHANEIMEFLYSVLTDNQRKELFSQIKPIKNVSNFYLPPEL